VRVLRAGHRNCTNGLAVVAQRVSLRGGAIRCQGRLHADHPENAGASTPKPLRITTGRIIVREKPSKSHNPLRRHAGVALAAVVLFAGMCAGASAQPVPVAVYVVPATTTPLPPGTSAAVQKGRRPLPSGERVPREQVSVGVRGGVPGRLCWHLCTVGVREARPVDLSTAMPACGPAIHNR